jgi:SAM-dependent methyltransferase
MAVLQFSNKAARALERIYSSADVVAQRKATLERLALRSGESVIDIGCGPGFLCDEMAEAVGENGQVLGVDISDDLLTVARERNARSRLTYEHGDAERLDQPEASFDVAVSVETLEFLNDPDRAIAEMFRVLKPGGRALMDPKYRLGSCRLVLVGPGSDGSCKTGLGGPLRSSSPPSNARNATESVGLHDSLARDISDYQHAPESRHLQRGARPRPA